MDYENLLDLVKKRRSTMVFKPDPIDDESVEKVIEAARWAPSGANSQPWELVIVKEEKTRKKIFDLMKDQSEISFEMEQTKPLEERFLHLRERRQGPPPFVTAPVLILMCGDPRTKAAYPLNAQLERGECNFYSSLASAFLYMHLAAASLGLGSKWISSSGLNYMECRLKKLLGIPLGLKIYDMMALGHAAASPTPRKVRAMAEIAHYESYDAAKAKTDREVKESIQQLWH